jgi:serine/threonine protein phosphatase PrpC
MKFSISPAADCFQNTTFANGKLSHFTLQNTYGKPTNEDAYMVGTAAGHCKLLMVADGMGGHPGGDLASKMLVDTISQAYRYKRTATMNPYLISTLDYCNRRLLDSTIEAGSTLCLALIEGEMVRFVTVGDSLAILLDARGQARYTSFEESSQGYADELDIAYPDDFLVNYMGFEQMTYQVSQAFKLGAGDQIYLMSDGAHAYFLQDHVQKIDQLHEDLVAMRQDQAMDDATCLQFIK